MGTAIKYPCTAQLDAAVSQAQCRGVPEALRHIFPDRQVRTKYNLAGKSFFDSRRDHFFLRGFTVPGKLAVHVCVPEPVMRKFGFHKIYIPFREKIISKINN